MSGSNIFSLEKIGRFGLEGQGVPALWWRPELGWAAFSPRSCDSAVAMADPQGGDLQWQCTQCTLYNKIHDSECEACGAKRPRRAVPHGIQRRRTPKSSRKRSTIPKRKTRRRTPRQPPKKVDLTVRESPESLSLDEVPNPPSKDRARHRRRRSYVAKQEEIIQSNGDGQLSRDERGEVSEARENGEPKATPPNDSVPALLREESKRKAESSESVQCCGVSGSNPAPQKSSPMEPEKGLAQQKPGRTTACPKADPKDERSLAGKENVDASPASESTEALVAVMDTKTADRNLSFNKLIATPSSRAMRQRREHLKHNGRPPQPPAHAGERSQDLDPKANGENVSAMANQQKTVKTMGTKNPYFTPKRSHRAPRSPTQSPALKSPDGLFSQPEIEESHFRVWLQYQTSVILDPTFAASIAFSADGTEDKKYFEPPVRHVREQIEFCTRQVREAEGACGVEPATGSVWDAMRSLSFLHIKPLYDATLPASQPASQASQPVSQASSTGRKDPFTPGIVDLTFVDETNHCQCCDAKQPALYEATFEGVRYDVESMRFPFRGAPSAQCRRAIDSETFSVGRCCLPKIRLLHALKHFETHALMRVQRRLRALRSMQMSPVDCADLTPTPTQNTKYELLKALMMDSRFLRDSFHGYKLLCKLSFRGVYRRFLSGNDEGGGEQSENALARLGKLLSNVEAGTKCSVQQGESAVTQRLAPLFRVINKQVTTAPEASQSHSSSSRMQSLSPAPVDFGGVANRDDSSSDSSSLTSPPRPKPSGAKRRRVVLSDSDNSDSSSVLGLKRHRSGRGSGENTHATQVLAGFNALSRRARVSFFKTIAPSVSALELAALVGGAPARERDLVSEVASLLGNACASSSKC